MSVKNRRKFSAEFKTKVVLEALKEQLSIEALAKKYDLHPTQINTWKKEFLLHASQIFKQKGKEESKEDEGMIQALYAQIGEQKVAIDFLKKKLQ